MRGVETYCWKGHIEVLLNIRKNGERKNKIYRPETEGERLTGKTRKVNRKTKKGMKRRCKAPSTGSLRHRIPRG